MLSIGPGVTACLARIARDDDGVRVVVQAKRWAILLELDDHGSARGRFEELEAPPKVDASQRRAPTTRATRQRHAGKPLCLARVIEDIRAVAPEVATQIDETARDDGYDEAAKFVRGLAVVGARSMVETSE